MKLKDYLTKNRLKKIHFAKKLGISRVTLDYYMAKPDKATLTAKLAIEYITTGEVSRDDWEVTP
jgi:DNA-binding transcriptional regulator YdaS (Cro superfamily)